MVAVTCYPMAMKYIIALNQTLHYSPKVMQQLLEHYHTAEAIIKAKPTELQQLGLQEKYRLRLTKINWAAVDAELNWLTHNNHFALTIGDPQYPELLRHISTPPYLLYIKGDPKHLHSPQVAIVGSRNPTHHGIETSTAFANALATAGFTITSGMAIGIDGHAHRAALSIKKPTIAVLGCGLQHVYPKRHQQLYHDIAAQGAVVSEFPLHVEPTAIHFPRRNRIISGLSLGTLVIQATVKSGSLITANLAAAQGREVFAIPGSIDDPLAKGCHHLIRQGAKLVESVSDITEELSLPTSIETNTTKLLDSDESQLLECVDFNLSSFGQIVRRSGHSVQNAAAMLLKLELHGYIKSLPSGYRRTKR